MLSVMNPDNLVSFPVDYQQLAGEVDQFLLVIEVLFDQTAHAADQTHGYSANRVKGRHQHQQGNVSVSGQVRSSSAAD